MKNKTTKTEIPSILYQYRPPELWALENLSRQVIYFGSPEKFNDPYDCNVPLGLKRLTAAEFVAFHKTLPVPNPVQEGLAEMLAMIKNASEEDAARIFNDTIPVAMEAVTREQIRIACFSARNDNLLMWSRYAGHGKGFCLAFDTQDKKLFVAGTIMPIKYDNKMPVVDNIEEWKNAPFTLWRQGWAYKSEDWKYEKEWRLFKNPPKEKDNKCERKYAPKTLKAIYFGTRVADGTKELIHSIAKEKYPHAELWQGQLSRTEFKVEFDRIR